MRVLLLGASGQIGQAVLGRLCGKGIEVVAVSRRPPNDRTERVTWLVRDLYEEGPLPAATHIVSAGPLDLLFAALAGLPEPPRRVVAFSSTSRFTKAKSSSAGERGLAAHIVELETRLATVQDGMEWVILRPTLVYGGANRSLSIIERTIKRLGLVPLFGVGIGQRQPVHTKDLAAAAVTALTAATAANHAYNLPGGEILSYRVMIERLFAKQGKRPRILRLPFWLGRAALVPLRLLPRYRLLTAAMLRRVDEDLLFNVEDAARELDYHPQDFKP